MQIIPLQVTPNQSLDIVLNGQACTINVYQKGTAVYVDLFINDAAIVTGILALNQVLIVREAYLGFLGDIAFIDMLATNADPQYTGFGNQFLLVYFLPTEL